MSEDTHWNLGNMIYGDNPQLLSKRKDPLGLTIYVYIPDVNSIRQSANLYVYCMNSPIMYIDLFGEYSDMAINVLRWGATTSGAVSQIDSPLPGPADITGGVIMGVTLIAAGGIEIWDKLSNPVPNGDTEYYGANIGKSSYANISQYPASTTEYRLPAWNKVKIDMKHIISGHTPGGGRGDGGKDNFPSGMKEAAITKALQEAYKNAEKLDSIQYSWHNGVEQARQFFQGSWGGRVIQFWYNYTTKTIETAWPK